jgi:MoaA/NifB/PqqE/SkfB family radical SAM enzyme
MHTRRGETNYNTHLSDEGTHDRNLCSCRIITLMVTYYSLIRAKVWRVRLALVAILSGLSLQRLTLLTRYCWRRTIRRIAVPQVITISVTNRCQCKCVHCSSNSWNIPQSGRSKQDELTRNEIENVIDQAAEMGIPRITFFGGEPLLREDICNLVKYASSRGMMTRINTNGLALDEEMVVRLKCADLTHCDVSIDSPDAEVHDRLRGVPGLFKKATEGMELLRAHKMLTQIVTYAGKRSLPEGLKRIIALGRRLDVTNVSIVFPMATGCWYKADSEILNEEERAQVRALASGRFVHVEIPTEQHRCNVLRKASLHIAADGSVTPCPFIPWHFGNIRERGLRQMTESFAERFHFNMRGECLMNNPQIREDLREIIQQIHEAGPKQPKHCSQREALGDRKG